MPQSLVSVDQSWTLLTSSDVELITVQMRPGKSGRLFIARGLADMAPMARGGLYFDASETSGVAGFTLDTLEPGGVGRRLWARFTGEDECLVWSSWCEPDPLEAR